MTKTDTSAAIAQAETMIALAKLADALGSATACELRRPASDTNGLTAAREVVMHVPREDAARALVEAIRGATAKL